MPRWIAFNHETAEAMVDRFQRGGVEIQDGDALSAALALKGNSLVVLPSKVAGMVLLAHMRPAELGENAEEGTYEVEASGFLGLSDTPVFARRSPVVELPKKKWWQRKKTA